MKSLQSPQGNKRSRLVIDEGSLVEVLRGLGPTILLEPRGGMRKPVAHFVEWLEKHVSGRLRLARVRIQ